MYTNFSTGSNYLSRLLTNFIYPSIIFISSPIEKWINVPNFVEPIALGNLVYKYLNAKHRRKNER